MLCIDVIVLHINYTSHLLNFNEPVTFSHCTLTSLTTVQPCDTRMPYVRIIFFIYIFISYRGVADTKKWGVGKQLDISICPINVSMQRHCCRQEVVISSKKKWKGYVPLLKKLAGSHLPLPSLFLPLCHRVERLYKYG